MEHFATWLINTYPLSSNNNRQLLQHGLRLFRQGNVIDAYVEETSIIGKIQDNGIKHVLIDTEITDLSRCSCGLNDLCAHQLASFLTIWSQTKTIASLIDSWKETSDSTPLSMENPKKSTTYVEDSLTSWLQFLENQHEQFKQAIPTKNTYLTGLTHAFFPKIRLVAPKKTEIRPLFLLHASFFCMKKVVACYDNSQPYQYIADILHRFVDIVEEEAKGLFHSAIAFQLDSLLNESRQLIRSELLEQEEPFIREWFYVYQFTWNDVFQRRNWMTTELKELENYRSLQAELAKTHLLFLQKRDEEALKLVKEYEDVYAPYLFHWIQALVLHKANNRLENWLSVSLPIMTKYIHSEPTYERKRQLTKHLLKLLSDFSLHMKQDAIFLEALRTLLPYSYGEYEWHLFERKEFRKWVELQLWMGFELNGLETYKLNQIKKADPYALFPLYHTAIHKALEQRNKTAYKEAASLLNVLHSLYKKEKLEDVWLQYLFQLKERTKRLRSFQEELKKGRYSYD
ncbi:hypothetical protein [Sutcliffiella rhizosphaerae]|uniref:SWIM-type domain-containing protein n=1 Tax=Sutcliffiella rhizosphaerae TaxID=2880967 RepID=A0ABM8YN93_9BACI|nr:hypothetical protein [Sutcliffiella rhizosphaerae]CAG9621385.1 hypothetical protein BACCIP111883_02158 [Sutcliffiella rhizosphaerae]